MAYVPDLDPCWSYVKCEIYFTCPRINEDMQNNCMNHDWVRTIRIDCCTVLSIAHQNPL